MIHELKILPDFYRAVVSGEKTFELRKNDRNFKVGDFVVLKEWTALQGYLGPTHTVRIKYVLENVPWYGLKEGYCIFSW